MEKKICKTCGFYFQYYTKSSDCFNKAWCGKCNKHHKTANYNDACEFWKDNLARKDLRQYSCRKSFEEAIQKIKEIAQILKEND